MKEEANSTLENEVSSYTPLYKLAGAAALALSAIILVQLAVFMAAPAPLEGTAVDWFMLFQSNPLAGLVGFELLMVIYMILSLPIALALYVILRRYSPSFTALYLALSLILVMAFISARPAFEMLALSNGWAAATTEVQKAMFVASGQTLVATFHGTAFHISYLLGSLSGLMISLVMLKSSIFGKTTVYLRIASSVCDLGLYLPVIGMYISMFSVLFLFIWNILIARRLFQLGRTNQKSASLINEALPS